MNHHSFDFEAIGTHWQIQSNSTMTDVQWHDLCRIITGACNEFDEMWSRFKEDSLVTRMSRKAGTYELSKDGYALLSLYEQLYQATAGKVTPLIGRLMEQTGYDANYSLRDTALSKPPVWNDTITYGEDSITLKQSALLDFGAAGKGYLVDRVSQILEEAGHEEYSINASGDILHRSRSPEPIRVGLENPVNPQEIIGVVELGNQSLCASSSSRRRWGKFHHIMDPVSLKPSDDMLATWVVCADTATADGLATALFFVEPERLTKHFSFSYAVLSNDMSLAYSSDFPVKLFEVSQ